MVLNFSSTATDPHISTQIAHTRISKPGCLFACFAIVDKVTLLVHLKIVFVVNWLGWDRFIAGSFRVSSLVIEREGPQHLGKGTMACFCTLMIIRSTKSCSNWLKCVCTECCDIIFGRHFTETAYVRDVIFYWLV